MQTKQSHSKPILYLLKKINQDVKSALDREFSCLELSPAQCNILRVLFQCRSPHICATDICVRLGLSRATVSSSLKKLRAMGYVTYTADEEDDRIKQILLTDEAFCWQREINRVFKKTIELLYKGFSQEERKTLEALLVRMLDNMEEASFGPSCKITGKESHKG